jgi:hypothetical protein
METKLTKTEKSFLDYGFRGDGKYRTTEIRGHSYSSTLYVRFLLSHRECIEVIEQGNDAPRGGQTGNYEIVKFTEKFFDKFGWYFEEKRKIEAVRVAEEEKKNILNEKLTILFTEFCKENPDKVEEWKNRILGISNKKSRMFKENRVARVTGNQDFWGKYRIFDKVIFG